MIYPFGLSQLYRPGTVAYVSKSGGMSNELNNIIARNSDGVYEGVAIGGDRYPGTRFIDHLLRYQDNPTVSVRKITCTVHIVPAGDRILPNEYFDTST